MRRIKKRNIIGNADRPRLSVYRSLNFIYAQIINDEDGHTVVSASSRDKNIIKNIKSGNSMEAAKVIGQEIAKKAIQSGIKKVVFDRGEKRFHGRIKALAEAARSEGLEF
jgi:large subunit ribosomal protein L18